MEYFIKYYNLVPIRFKRASNILNLVKESYCLKMGMGLLKREFPRKIDDVCSQLRSARGEKSVCNTRLSRAPYSRAGIGLRHGVLSVNRIPIVVTAITPTGLAPNDFSHSLSLLSRSLSYGSDAGSFCWAPITDTMNFLKWLVGYCPLRAMTESSFGSIASIKDGLNNDITSSPAIRTPQTYTGREWDEEIGLYYYRARYYDPGVGRFLQEDPEPGRINDPSSVVNKYIYVGNNPILNIDPTGRSFLGDLFRVVLAVVVVVIAFYTGGTAYSAIFGSVSTATASVASSIGLSAATSSAIGTVIGAIAGFTGAVGAGATVGALIGGIGNGITSSMEGGSFEKGFDQGASIGWQLGALSGSIGAFAGVGFSESPGSFGKFLTAYPWTVALPGLMAPFDNNLNLKYKCGTDPLNPCK